MAPDNVRNYKREIRTIMRGPVIQGPSLNRGCRIAAIIADK